MNMEGNQEQKNTEQSTPQIQNQPAVPTNPSVVKSNTAADVTPTPQSTPTPTPTPASIMTEPMDRRTFIKWTAVGWAAFGAVIAGYGTMFLRFMFPNVLFEPKQTFKAGFPDEYQIGEVSERWKDKYATWIVRDEEKIYALSTVCTHLGCTPNWLANDNKFKCPCHGSGFYRSGINFEGPAPRPLERFKITLADDGQTLVDKTKKYEQEKGEWKDSESYLVV